MTRPGGENAGAAVGGTGATGGATDAAVDGTGDAVNSSRPTATPSISSTPVSKSRLGTVLLGRGSSGASGWVSTMLDGYSTARIGHSRFVSKLSSPRTERMYSPKLSAWVA